MQKVIATYKNLGETPLECLERVRAELIDKKTLGISNDTPMTYAGRLDPMAEGQLIILIGDECKNKEKYLGFDKKYEVEVLFGISTDTCDVLGLVENVTEKPLGETSLFFEPERTSQGGVGKESLCSQKVFLKYIGKFTQEYPKYSSKTVNGKQLHTYAREGNMPEEMPTKEVEIYSIENLGTKEILGKEIVDQVLEKISKVKGDFRQKEITEKWSSLLKDESNRQNFNETKFTILKIKVKCSSGTYMRTLANKMGKDNGTHALAFSIKRLGFINLALAEEIKYNTN